MCVAPLVSPHLSADSSLLCTASLLCARPVVHCTVPEGAVLAVYRLRPWARPGVAAAPIGPAGERTASATNGKEPSLLLACFTLGGACSATACAGISVCGRGGRCINRLANCRKGVERRDGTSQLCASTGGASLSEPPPSRHRPARGPAAIPYRGQIMSLAKLSPAGPAGRQASRLDQPGDRITGGRGCRGPGWGGGSV